MFWGKDVQVCPQKTPGVINILFIMMLSGENLYFHIIGLTVIYTHFTFSVNINDLYSMSFIITITGSRAERQRHPSADFIRRTRQSYPHAADAAGENPQGHRGGAQTAHARGVPQTGRIHWGG